MKNIVKVIGCSGEYSPGRYWREGILSYLNNTWRGDSRRSNNIYLQFNDTRINHWGNQYLVSFVDQPDYGEMPYVYGHGVELIHEPKQNDVEIGLARFVRDEHVRHLYMLFPQGITDPNSDVAKVVISKTERRGEILIATEKVHVDSVAWKLPRLTFPQPSTRFVV